MSFRDVFDKYKQGKATAEEISFIEEELEKSELINDYLSEKYSTQMQNSELDALLPDIPDTTKKIRTNINRKLISVIAICVFLVGALYLAVQFILFPAINAAYYNPDDGYVNKVNRSYSQFFINTAVYTELHFAGNIADYAQTQPLGFGRYDIKIKLDDFFNSSQNAVYTGQINKGKMINLPESFFKFPYANAFTYGVYPYYPVGEQERQNVLAELAKMPETALAKVYVSFKDDLSLSEVKSLMNQNKNLHFTWIAVRCVDKNTQGGAQFGFEPSGSGPVIKKEAIDEAKYPYLELANAFEYGNRELPIEAYQQHFASLLKYMVDRPGYVRLFNSDPGIYSSALDYIRNKGVNSYGAVTIGYCRDILKLAENSAVDSLMIDDIKLSLYSK